MRALPAGALLALTRFVLGSARLKRIARRMLQAAPGVHARLQLLMHRAALPPRTTAPELMKLSSRARQLHRQLQRQLKRLRTR